MLFAGRSWGYTFIELLMVVGLLGLVTITMTTLLFSSFSGSGKASGLAVVKQNGDHTVGVIERMLRDARRVTCSQFPGDDTLTVIDVNGTTTFALETDGGGNVRIASNSGVYLTSEQLTPSSFTCSQTAGTEAVPDVVSVSFILSLGDPLADRPQEVASERFETRVSLRTY